MTGTGCPFLIGFNGQLYVPSLTHPNSEAHPETSVSR